MHLPSFRFRVAHLDAARRMAYRGRPITSLATISVNWTLTSSPLIRRRTAATPMPTHGSVATRDHAASALFSEWAAAIIRRTRIVRRPGRPGCRILPDHGRKMCTSIIWQVCMQSRARTRVAPTVPMRASHIMKQRCNGSERDGRIDGAPAIAVLGTLARPASRTAPNGRRRRGRLRECPKSSASPSRSGLAALP